MSDIESRVTPSMLEVNRFRALANLKQSLESPEEVVLREHQYSMAQAVHDFLQSGESAGYLSEPTGVGKSVMMAYLAHILGLRTIILSPTQQILTQTFQAAKQFFPDVDISNYFAEEKNVSGKVINTTYQSILSLSKSSGRGISLDEVELVLCDESHLGLGEKRHTVYRNFPNAIFMGLTATPYFAPLAGFHERGLVEKEERWTGMFRNCIHEMTLEEVIERKILANLDVFMFRSNTVVSDIKILSSGEYRQQDLEKFFTTLSRDALILAMVGGVGDLSSDIRISEAQKESLRQIHERIKDRKMAIFAVSIDHANGLVAKLQEKGISAAAIHSKIDSDKRKEILAAHKRGEINVIVGVDMLRIGWDSPETEVGIYARPTASGVVKTQEVGRILRRTNSKDRAIAIELVDKITDKRQAQVLIPHIFDPEFVLRGSTSGREPTLSTSEIKREKPQITFSGMDIDSVIEEARSQEMLRRRFKQSSIAEISQWLEATAANIITQNPEIGSYGLLSLIIEDMPQKIPFEAQYMVLQALASLDTNTQTLGKKVLPFLYARQLISAVDYCALTDDSEEKEELLQEAIVVITEKACRLNSNNVPLLISTLRNELTGYAAQRYGIPRPLVATPASRILVSTIEEVLGEEKIMLSANEIDSLAVDLSRETGVPESTLKAYLRYRLTRGATITANEVEEAAERTELKQILEQVLETIPSRERRVVNLRFGLEDGRERTFKEVGAEFDLTGGRIMQIESKALRKLRYPSRAKKFRDFAYFLPGNSRDQQALMNGAITGVCQGDYARVIANLGEIEGIVCEPLSTIEKEMIESLKNYQGSYRWDSEALDKFFNWYIRDKQINLEDPEELINTRDHIQEAVKKLREVWELSFKISRIVPQEFQVDKSLVVEFDSSLAEVVISTPRVEEKRESLESAEENIPKFVTNPEEAKASVESETKESQPERGVSHLQSESRKIKQRSHQLERVFNKLTTLLNKILKF